MIWLEKILWLYVDYVYINIGIVLTIIVLSYLIYKGLKKWNN